MKHCETCRCESEQERRERVERERAETARAIREADFAARHSVLREDDREWIRERLAGATS